MVSITYDTLNELLSWNQSAGLCYVIFNCTTGVSEAYLSRATCLGMKRNNIQREVHLYIHTQIHSICETCPCFLCAGKNKFYFFMDG